MVIVTERIGTALVRSENALQSQRDILLQLLTGDFPDLHILQQRAIHQQLDFSRPLRVVALRLEGIQNLFRQFPPGQAEAWLQQARRTIRQRLQQQLNQQENPFRWSSAAICLSSCCRMRTVSFISRKSG
jgi:hypothetical protein